MRRQGVQILEISGNCLLSKSFSLRCTDSLCSSTAIKKEHFLAFVCAIPNHAKVHLVWLLCLFQRTAVPTAPAAHVHTLAACCQVSGIDPDVNSR